MPDSDVFSWYHPGNASWFWRGSYAPTALHLARPSSSEELTYILSCSLVMLRTCIRGLESDLLHFLSLQSTCRLVQHDAVLH